MSERDNSPTYHDTICCVSVVVVIVVRCAQTLEVFLCSVDGIHGMTNCFYFSFFPLKCSALKFYRACLLVANLFSGVCLCVVDFSQKLSHVKFIQFFGESKSEIEKKIRKKIR